MYELSRNIKRKRNIKVTKRGQVASKVKIENYNINLNNVYLNAKVTYTYFGLTCLSSVCHKKLMTCPMCLDTKSSSNKRIYRLRNIN